MKKFFVVLLAALLLLTAYTYTALAESAAEPEVVAESVESTPVETVREEKPSGTLPTTFTWQYLASTAGAAVLAFAIAQFIKAPLDKVWKIPTRLLVYAICLVTLLVATAFLNDGLTIEKASLSVFNALISAYSAYGMYEVWIRKKEAAKA